MPTGVLVVMLIGFLNVCLGYAFAQYFWPDTSTGDRTRPASHLSPSASSTTRAPTARIARPVRPGTPPPAERDPRETDVLPDSGASSGQSTGRGSPGEVARSNVEERVANKVQHLHKRLQRISQQIRQLGDSPDPSIAGTLRQRIDRVARGGIEDLRYAVDSAANDGSSHVNAAIDGLAQHFASIIDSMAELTFDDDALKTSIEAMNNAADELVAAIAETSQALG